MVVKWSSCGGRQEREGVRDREGGVREQMQVQVQVVKMRSRVGVEGRTRRDSGVGVAVQ